MKTMINIFFSKDLIDKNNSENSKLFNSLNKLDNVRLILVSWQIKSASLDTNLFTLKRTHINVKQFINNHPGRNIFIGNLNQDFFSAVNTKILFLFPEWIINPREEKALKYGVHVRNTEHLINMLHIFNNLNTLYYTLPVDELTTVYALTSANNYGATDDENEVINKFRQVLKENDKEYLDVIKLTLSSGLSINPLIQETDIWSIMPSSGTTLNPTMLDIKDQIRYQYKSKLDTSEEPLLIRHTPTKKSHETPIFDRLEEGAAKHLSSIHINPYYRDRLKDKNVTILDDYVTNGISFESIRNLLATAGVKKINFIAIGRFTKFSKNNGKGIYQKEDFEITGDIYSPNFSYALKNKQDIGAFGVYSEEAKHSISLLKDLLI